MKRTRTVSSALALSTAAHAKVMPLERLPANQLVALAPLLQHGDDDDAARPPTAR